jgi:hypothetical protein
VLSCPGNTTYPSGLYSVLTDVAFGPACVTDAPDLVIRFHWMEDSGGALLGPSSGGGPVGPTSFLVLLSSVLSGTDLRTQTSGCRPICPCGSSPPFTAPRSVARFGVVLLGEELKCVALLFRRRAPHTRGTGYGRIQVVLRDRTGHIRRRTVLSKPYTAFSRSFLWLPGLE